MNGRRFAYAFKDSPHRADGAPLAALRPPPPIRALVRASVMRDGEVGRRHQRRLVRCCDVVNEDGPNVRRCAPHPAYHAEPFG